MGIGFVVEVVRTVEVSGAGVVVIVGGIHSEEFTRILWARKSCPLFRLTSTKMILMHKKADFKKQSRDQRLHRGFLHGNNSELLALGPLRVDS